MIYIKRHFSGHKTVVGICDQDLIGKRFVEGEKALAVSEFFFKGELFDKVGTAVAIEGAYSLNIVGKEAIEICLDLGILPKENISYISEIPYALVFELEED